MAAREWMADPVERARAASGAAYAAGGAWVASSASAASAALSAVRSSTSSSSSSSSSSSVSADSSTSSAADDSSSAPPPPPPTSASPPGRGQAALEAAGVGTAVAGTFAAVPSLATLAYPVVMKATGTVVAGTGTLLPSMAQGGAAASLQHVAMVGLLPSAGLVAATGAGTAAAYYAYRNPEDVRSGLAAARGYVPEVRAWAKF